MNHAKLLWHFGFGGRFVPTVVSVLTSRILSEFRTTAADCETSTVSPLKSFFACYPGRDLKICRNIHKIPKQETKRLWNNEPGTQMLLKLFKDSHLHYWVWMDRNEEQQPHILSVLVLVVAASSAAFKKWCQIHFYKKCNLLKDAIFINKVVKVHPLCKKNCPCWQNIRMGLTEAISGCV